MQSNYSLYYNHKDGQVAKLNEETKKDLRSHHFRLGYNTEGLESQKSEAKSHFVTKKVSDDLKREMEISRNNSRAAVYNLNYFLFF